LQGIYQVYGGHSLLLFFGNVLCSSALSRTGQFFADFCIPILSCPFCVYFRFYTLLHVRLLKEVLKYRVAQKS